MFLAGDLRTAQLCDDFTLQGSLKIDQLGALIFAPGAKGPQPWLRSTSPCSRQLRQRRGLAVGPHQSSMVWTTPWLISFSGDS